MDVCSTMLDDGWRYLGVYGGGWEVNQPQPPHGGGAEAAWMGCTGFYWIERTLTDAHVIYMHFRIMTLLTILYTINHVQ